MQDTHTEEVNSADVLSAVDVISSVFQTYLPEQLHDLMNGNMTVEEFDNATSHEVCAVIHN